MYCVFTCYFSCGILLYGKFGFVQTNFLYKEKNVTYSLNQPYLGPKSFPLLSGDAVGSPTRGTFLLNAIIQAMVSLCWDLLSNSSNGIVASFWFQMAKGSGWGMCDLILTYGSLASCSSFTLSNSLCLAISLNSGENPGLQKLW